MPLNEVKTISENTDVDIKIFNHGAMCYCRSGQCLMSSLIGGRSGNRGLCAQPCRKKYALITGDGEKPYAYRLSMKDLNTVFHTREITDAGVDALKIEGRLKSPEYIYSVVKAYRNALDLAEDEKTGSKTGDAENHTKETKNLKKATQEMAAVFHRGFTEGRLFDVHDVINPTVQKHYGVLVGKVKACSRGRLTIALHRGFTLNQGDGLAFGEKADRGARVDKIIAKRGDEAVIPVRIHLKKGEKVYRNFDSALNEIIHKRIDTAPIITQIPVKLCLTFREGCPVSYRAVTDNVTEGEIAEIIPGRAEKRPLTGEIITAQMTKTGESLYRFSSVSSEIKGKLFLSKKELNTVRREIIARLSSDKQTSKKIPNLVLDEPYRCFGKPDVAVNLLKASDFSRLYPLSADEWILPLEAPEDIPALKPMIDTIHRDKKRVALAFPQVLTTGACAAFENRLDDALALKPDGFLVRNYEAFAMLTARGIRPEVDATMHVANAVSANAFKAWGASAATLSVETHRENMKAVIQKSPLPITAVVYGRQQMMISDHCLMDCEKKQCVGCVKQGAFSLKDERGALFPGYRGADGMTRIYNSAVLKLTPKDLKALSGAAKYRLDVTDESKEQMGAVIAELTADTNKSNGTLPAVSQATPNYTKGNYDRGVK